MIKQLLNEFRTQNNVSPAKIDDWEENQNCLFHCHYMARIQEICHAPEYLRQREGYILSEACGGRNFAHNPNETLRLIIFEQLGKSSEHREIMLMDNIACAFHMDFMNHFTYVTIRG